jgi:hypothetical protein
MTPTQRPRRSRTSLQMRCTDEYEVPPLPYSLSNDARPRMRAERGPTVDRSGRDINAYGMGQSSGMSLERGT